MIHHTFRRAVLPLENVFVDVDLYDVIDGGPWIPAAPSNVDPIIEWVRDGKIALDVLNPHDYLSEEHRKLLNDERFVRSSGTGKSYDHRRLCVLAALYLISTGKSANCSGNSLCSYSGGWADVRADDGSLYVECGTLNPTKPMMAMKHFVNLMIIPYNEGDLAYRFTPTDKDFFKEYRHATLFTKNAAKGLL
jgi:hypothetical protein